MSQLAQAVEPEPGAEEREVVQRLGFVLEGGDVVVHHVHEDEPGLVVLRALVGEGEAALLRERLLGHVLRELQALDLHADVREQLGVAPALLDEVLLHARDALAGDEAEALAASHLVHQLHLRLGVAEVELEAAGALLVEDAALVALHHEGAEGAEADGVDAVDVAVEVRLEDPVLVEDAAVGAEARGVLVLGSVDGVQVALVRAAQDLELVGAKKIIKQVGSK